MQMILQTIGVGASRLVIDGEIAGQRHFWRGSASRGRPMPKYLFHGTYAPEAVREVMEGGFTKRSEAVHAGIEQLGGSVDALYWGQGGVGSYVPVELPDDAAAHAMVLAASQGAGTATATRLLNAAEADVARERGSSFRSPGT